MDRKAHKASVLQSVQYHETKETKQKVDNSNRILISKDEQEKFPRRWIAEASA